ncbi:Two-component system WalR/WalK regulatory protein YycI [Bacillus paralicheniformis]|uniref:Two-component system regulatory protein YycI n=1 Tax=Bacillus paralicheniformis TaxID=1648923 RepID=A0A7Z1B3R7_9BACI|nr:MULTISPECIES: two-component system regulatory protein YycI [Bacillus]MBW4884541.1 two-component system regulatory protein YycI [Bacillus sp. (in: firmicutes)]MCJ8220541.1 two-component system regulatory protein YycI [Bacillus paralicheniformis]MCQ5453775.1 two-component system regulatory protein YycI [Bacillus paralicheniformis]MDE1453929.1 two-component system regulatory protein YycI [Bacillus paralicheniformis]MEC1826165.1 two-component system regulatory protein YycI [Bacillus paralicheni
MEWNRTKTIFIIVFLILDIFLAFQYFDKRSNNQFPILEKSTLQEDMKADHISYGNLSKETSKGSSISAQKRVFKQSEIKSLKGQKPKALMNTAKENALTEIEMEFETPIALPKADMETKAREIVNEEIIDGNKYKLWKVDKSGKQIVFFQTYNGNYIFQDRQNDDNTEMGEIVLYLNNKNEVVSYKQSMLQDIKEVKTESLISAVGAVEALYYPDYLKKYSKIKSAELGYFTQYPLASAQIFVPVWRIEVERKTDDKTIHEEFIVDARDGALLQSQEKKEKS